MNGKNRFFTRNAHDGNIRIHLERKVFCNGKPEAAAAASAGGCVISGKNLRLFVWGNAGPVVFHFDSDRASRAGEADAEIFSTAAVEDGVVCQIFQDARERFAVGIGINRD